MLLLVQMSTSVQSLSGPACSGVRECVDTTLLYATSYRVTMVTWHVNESFRPKADITIAPVQML